MTAMVRIAGVNSGDKVYDLGCGDGRFVIAAARRGAVAVGYDLAWGPYLMGRISACMYGQGRATILMEDMWTADLSDASVIFLYLLPPILKLLQTKILAEVQPGTIVCSYRYTFQGWRAVESESVEGFCVHKYIVGDDTPAGAATFEGEDEQTTAVFFDEGEDQRTPVFFERV